ncbi:MAG TPA: hypothetical protein VE974_07845 [Thermoanaerobaculia bacterium]|nr:hypothetical protein [Thermoanaerobaculia bacterium]
MSASAPVLDQQFPLLDVRPAPLRPILLPEPPLVESLIEAPAPDSVRDDVKRLRESLKGTAAAKLMNATELLRALEKERRDEQLPTTLDAFDSLLGGGLPRGKMVELTGRRGAGRFSIVLSALAAATSMGEAAVFVDLGDHLDPRTAEEMGVDLQRVLWIRPKTLKQAVMSAEMITATGFQLVVLDAGTYPVRGRRAPEAAWVRLARAAEAHGTAMLISTPYPATGTASEAVIVAQRTRLQWHGRGKSPRLLLGAQTELHLEKHRHRKAGAVTTLALTMEEGRGLRAEGRGETPAPHQSRERVASPSALSPLPSALSS